jgi:hypothetical protein
MKSIFRVEVEAESFEMYVYAEDANGARALALKHASEELGNIDDDFRVLQVRVVPTVDEVDDYWLDAVPYGEDSRSVAEVLESSK